MIAEIKSSTETNAKKKRELECLRVKTKKNRTTTINAACCFFLFHAERADGEKQKKKDICSNYRLLNCSCIVTHKRIPLTRLTW